MCFFILSILLCVRYTVTKTFNRPEMDSEFRQVCIFCTLTGIQHTGCWLLVAGPLDIADHQIDKLSHDKCVQNVRDSSCHMTQNIRSISFSAVYWFVAQVHILRCEMGIESPSSLQMATISNHTKDYYLVWILKCLVYRHQISSTMSNI